MGSIRADFGAQNALRTPPELVKKCAIAQFARTPRALGANVDGDEGLSVVRSRALAMRNSMCAQCARAYIRARTCALRADRSADRRADARDHRETANGATDPASGKKVDADRESPRPGTWATSKRSSPNALSVPRARSSYFATPRPPKPRCARFNRLPDRISALPLAAPPCCALLRSKTRYETCRWARSGQRAMLPAMQSHQYMERTDGCTT